VVRIPADERRRQLVAAAFRVMAADGVGAATTRAIAAEAGMPLSSFHYCFRSKNELLGELAGQMVSTEVSAAAQVLTPEDGLEVTIRGALRAYWQLVEESPGEHQVLYELTQVALRTPGLEGLAQRQYARYQAGCREMIERIGVACEVEWLLPLDVLARMLVTLLDGLTLNWLVDRDSAQALAVLDASADQFAALSRRTSTHPSRAPRSGRPHRRPAAAGRA
jgi:AcrR family transcriptional regulator